MQQFVRNRLVAVVSVLTLVLAAHSPAQAQRRLVSSRYKNGSAVRKAFRSVVAATNKATVSILSGGKQVALGAVVEPEGYIITKASELDGLVTCLFRDGRKLNGQIVGIAKDDDLALVKVDADDAEFETVEWRTGDDPRVGNWLATPGTEDVPVSVGVVSVKRRRIPSPRPLLGVSVEDHQHGAKIVQVSKGSGAEKAGLKAGDVITWIAGKAVKNRQILSQQIRQFRPGDMLELKVRRNNNVMRLKATLGSSQNVSSRGAIQNRMGGKLSNRRAGFPDVLQHDSYLKPEHCGGPVVDLNGRVVGINIARAGRTESYAVPANRVLALLPDLRSGKLAPPKVWPELPAAPPLPEFAKTK